MADDITSWVAKALIDQDASTGDYAAPRTGHLVQVVKFETYRTPSQNDRQIRAIAHDRTHSVNLAFDVQATDAFELSQHGLEGVSLTQHLRHVFLIKRFRFDVSAPHSSRRSIVPGSRRQLPEVTLQVLDWEVPSGSKDDPVFHERVSDLGYGKGDTVLQRVLIKIWYGENVWSQGDLTSSHPDHSGRSALSASSSYTSYRDMSTFLLPYLFPPAGKKPKPIPDWLFTVSDEDRQALSEITVFGLDSNVEPPSQPQRSRLEKEAALLVKDEEEEEVTSSSDLEDGEYAIGYGPAMSSPGDAGDGSGDDSGGNERVSKAHEQRRAASEVEEDRSEVDWEPSPNIRRRIKQQPAAPSRVDLHLVDDDDQNESIDVLIPPRPLTQTSQAVTASAAQESLHLFPQQDMHRAATPAIFKGVAGLQRPSDGDWQSVVPVRGTADPATTANQADDTDIDADVTMGSQPLQLYSQRSDASSTAPHPVSSGQSMVVKPPRKPNTGRNRRTEESLEMMRRYNSQSTSTAGSQDGTSAAKAGTVHVQDQDLDWEGRGQDDGADEEAEAGFGPPQATMPFPPAGQKRGSSLLLESPSGGRWTGRMTQGRVNEEERPEGDEERQLSPSVVPLIPGSGDADSGGGVDEDELVSQRDMAYAQTGTRSMGDGAGPRGQLLDVGDASRRIAIETHAQLQPEGRSGSSNGGAGATRATPTASQRALPPSHPSPASAEARSSPVKPDTSFEQSHSGSGATGNAAPNAEGQSLESTKTVTSQTGSGHSTKRSGETTSTSTHTSSGRMAEGQRPIPSRGGQTSFIGQTVSMVREPTSSLSQSQGREGDEGLMSLSKYASDPALGQSTKSREQQTENVANHDRDEGLDVKAKKYNSTGDSRGPPEQKAQRHPSSSKGQARYTPSPDRPSTTAHSAADALTESLRPPVSKRRKVQSSIVEPPSRGHDAHSPAFLLREAGIRQPDTARSSGQPPAADPDTVSGPKANAIAGPSRHARFIGNERKRSSLASIIRPPKRPRSASPPASHLPSDHARGKDSAAGLESPEDRKPRQSALERDQEPSAMNASRQVRVLASEDQDRAESTRDLPSRAAIHVKAEQVSPDRPASTAGAYAATSERKRKSSRRSSHPRQRPPLLLGFQPVLDVPLGLNMAWLAEEMADMAKLRRDQGFL